MGSVRWFQYWNPNLTGGSSKGVTDLLYNHEVGTNAGNITAVSVDENTTFGHQNLYVTILNSTGILNSEQLTDAGNDYYSVTNPAGPSGAYLKPRIVESVSDSEYCVLGNRNTSPSELVIWKMQWNFAAKPGFPVI